MRNIQFRKNDILYIFTGINKEINRRLAERNLGKEKEWVTLPKLDRDNRIRKSHVKI